MDEMDELEVKDQLFTNLKLLGFDVASNERKYRILFKRDMFDLPNKDGFEVVIHFLFQRLDPVKSRETFRNCWPVRGKKQEQEFRKVCHAWLAEISKEESSFELPAIAPSLFLAPGGDRLYELLRSFSELLLFKIMVVDHGVNPQTLLKSAPLTPDTQPLSDVVARVIKASTVRLSQSFVKNTQRSQLEQRQWKLAADKQIRRYHDLTKRIREREAQCAELKQQAAAGNIGSRGQSTSVDSDIDRVQRTQKLEKVRAMWQTVSEFDKAHIHQSEVLDSVLEGGTDKYCIDARQMNVRVPQVLLQECEQEIRRRGVQNIYEGGKLNLVSLFHLFNLSLHLIVEKIHVVGLPDVSEAMPIMTSQLQTHRAHLANINNLKVNIDAEIAAMRTSIKSLKKQRAEMSATSTPDNFLTTVPLSPLINVTAATPPVPRQTADKLPYNIADIAPPPAANVDTPIATQQLMQAVDGAVRTPSHPVAVPQGSPQYGTNVTDQQARKSSQLPVAEDGASKVKVTSRHGRPLPGHHLQAPPGVTAVKFTSSGTTLIENPENSEAKSALASKQTSHVTDAERETSKRRFVIGACIDSTQTSAPSGGLTVPLPGYMSPVSSPKMPAHRVHYDDNGGGLATQLFNTSDDVSPSSGRHTEPMASSSPLCEPFTNMDVEAVVNSVINSTNHSPRWSANVNTNSNVVSGNNDVREALLPADHSQSDDSDAEVSERLIVVHEGSFSEVVVRTPSKNNTGVMSDIPVTSSRDASHNATPLPSTSSTSKDSLVERYRKLRSQVMPVRQDDDDVNFRHDVSPPTVDIPSIDQSTENLLAHDMPTAPSDEQCLKPTEVRLDQYLDQLLKLSPSRDRKEKLGVTPKLLMANSQPMSPMTSILHDEPMHYLHADDIFGEKDSLLVPSSPLEGGRLSLNRQSLGLGMTSIPPVPSNLGGSATFMSPPTGKLLDL